MKLVQRTGLSRGYGPKPSMDFTSIERESLIARKDCRPQEPIKPLHSVKRPAESKSALVSPMNKIHYQNDQNTTARVETNPIYDSRKETADLQSIADWKILTLKQIKNRKGLMGSDEKGSTPRSSGQKIFVSISKSNRNSLSRDKPNNAEPKLSEMGNSHKCLSSLKRGGQIVDKVEYQIE